MLHTRAIGVVGAYAIASVLAFWPLPLHLFDAVWGAHAPTWSLMWAFDQPDPITAYAVDLQQVGTQAAASPAVLWAGRLLRLAGLPLPAALNTLLLLGIWAAGLAAHALGRTLSGSHWGGFLAGSTFISSPILAVDAINGQTGPVLVWLIPAAAWATIAVLRTGQARESTILAVLLAASGFAGVWLLGASSVIVLFLTVWQAIDTRRKPPVGLLVIGGTAVATALWMVANEPIESLAMVHGNFHSGSGLGLLVPAVAVLGAAGAGRRGLPWLGIGVTGALLYNINQYLPRYYSEGQAYLALCATSALGAAGWAVLHQTFPRASAAGTAIIAIFAAFQVGFALPWAIRTSVSPVPTRVDVPILPFVVTGDWLDLPLLHASDSLAGARARFRQTLHHQPLFSPRSDGENALGVSHFQSFAAAGVGYVVVRTRIPMDEVTFPSGQSSPELAMEPIFSGLNLAFSAPVAQSGGMLIYAVSALPSSPAFPTAHALPSPLDYSAFHLPVVLERDGSLPLFEGAARQFSVWLAAESAGTLAIRIRSSGKSRVVPIPLEKNVWGWHAIPIVETTPVTITAEATEPRIEFRFTGAQVTL